MADVVIIVSVKGRCVFNYDLQQVISYTCAIGVGL